MSSRKDMPRRRMQIADNIPESEWSDARTEYMNTGKTVKEIAKERGCEARAISRLIRENRDFADMGKWRTPARIDGFQEAIEHALRSDAFRDTVQITEVSRQLLKCIRPLGYTGSERTLRYYLDSIPWLDWVRGYP